MRGISVSAFHFLLIILTLALPLAGRGKKKRFSHTARIRDEHYCAPYDEGASRWGYEFKTARL